MIVCANGLTLVSIPAPIVSGLLHHNIKEFANLARILPSLYE